MGPEPDPKDGPLLSKASLNAACSVRSLRRAAAESEDYRLYIKETTGSEEHHGCEERGLSVVVADVAAAVAA